MGVDIRLDAVNINTYYNSMGDHIWSSAKEKISVARIEFRIILVRLFNSYKLFLCLRLQHSGTRCSLIFLLNSIKPFPLAKALLTAFTIHPVRFIILV